MLNILNIICIDSSLQVCEKQERKEVQFSTDVLERFTPEDSDAHSSPASSCFLEWKQSGSNQSGFFLPGLQKVQGYLFSLCKITQYELIGEKQLHQKTSQGMNSVVVRQQQSLIST